MTGWDALAEAYEQVVGDDCTLDMAAERIVAALDTECPMVSRLRWIEEAAAVIRKQLKARGLPPPPPDDNRHIETGEALLWLALRTVAFAAQYPNNAGPYLQVAERTLRVWWARQQPGNDL